MKAHLPSSPPPENDPSPPPATSSPVPARASRRLRWGLPAVLVLLGAGIGGWWFWSRKPPAPEPPLPPGIVDPEVKVVVERSRAEVLADPTSGDAWGRYGLVLLGNLIDREADECFARASELSPSDPRWPYARGLIAVKRRPLEAPELFRQTITAAEGDREYRAVASLALGEVLLERGELDEAAELFQSQLGRGGVGEARAVFGLGLVAVARGDAEEAYQRFQAVQSIEYCQKQVAIHLATLTRARGDTEAARRHERRVRQLGDDPAWPDPILDHIHELRVGYRGREQRIDRLQRSGQFREALREYEIQLARERTPKALIGAGVNHARLEEYDEALKLLREAVKREPTHVQSHYTLALVLFTRAEKTWHASPGSPRALEDFREVIVEAKRAAELKPDHVEAYLFWGLALKFLDRPKEAIAPLRTGLGVRPDDFMLNLTLGQVLAASGDRAGAINHLKTARKLNPDDSRPVEELKKLGVRE